MPAAMVVMFGSRHSACSHNIIFLARGVLTACGHDTFFFWLAASCLQPCHILFWALAPFPQPRYIILWLAASAFCLQPHQFIFARISSCAGALSIYVARSFMLGASFLWPLLIAVVGASGPQHYLGQVNLYFFCCSSACFQNTITGMAEMPNVVAPPDIPSAYCRMLLFTAHGIISYAFYGYFGILGLMPMLL